MSGLTYEVVRRPGGWAVEYGDRVLCCFRTQEQAVAEARLLGRDGWAGEGRPSRVQVRGVTGTVRTEVVFGEPRSFA